jgi:hypothetical protein
MERGADAACVWLLIVWRESFCVPPFCAFYYFIIIARWSRLCVAAISIVRFVVRSLFQ